MNIEITIASNDSDYFQSAELITYNEPWKSFKRTLDYSLKKVKNEDSVLFVAKDENKILGCLLLDTKGQLTMFVRSLCVSHEVRGKSIGKLLLETAETYSFEENSNVFLFVSENNKLAQQFYYKNGYTKIGEITEFLISGNTEYILRKTTGPTEE